MNTLFQLFSSLPIVLKQLLSLNASDSPPFHVLGNYVAFGVLCALVYTMTLLPALLSILPLRSSSAQSDGTVFFDRFADFVIARRKFLL